MEATQCAVVHTKRSGEHILDVDARATQRCLVRTDVFVLQAADIANQIDCVNRQPVQDSPTRLCAVKEPVFRIALLDGAGDHPSLNGDDAAQDTSGDELTRLVGNRMTAVQKGRRPQDLLLGGDFVEAGDISSRARDRFLGNNRHASLQKLRDAIWRLVVARAYYG